MGSRFGGLKQLAQVGPRGEKIIDYTIYDAVRAGFDRVVFIIKEELYDTFREVIGDPLSSRVKVGLCIPAAGGFAGWRLRSPRTDQALGNRPCGALL